MNDQFLVCKQARGHMSSMTGGGGGGAGEQGVV